MTNNYDIINDFRTAALDSGIELPANIKADGQSHRFKINGKTNGFYRLHLDGIPAGCFQDWAINDKPINWKHTRPHTPLTAQERLDYAAKIEASNLKRNAEQQVIYQNAATEAQRIWTSAYYPIIDHPYLSLKRIQAHGARIYNHALVLPLFGDDLRLTSLQFISANGAKRFLTGGRKRGCYWWIGGKAEKILIAEGFATAASLHEATGYQCFVAFDAGNLTPVAEIIRAKKPHAEIVLCADYDESGKGQLEAEKAAWVIDGLIAMPPVLGDFNDYITQAKGE